MAKDGKKSKAEVAAVTVATARRAACEEDAERFKSLGDPTRLCIVAFLRTRLSLETAVSGAAAAAAPERADAVEEEAEEAEEATPGSVTVGEISCHVFGADKVPSTLSHHLKELRRAGLVTMKRRGKNILCRLDVDALHALTTRLLNGDSGAVIYGTTDAVPIDIPVSSERNRTGKTEV